jgi:hypothetical protein
MAEPRAPYVVTFTADPVPDHFLHSNPNPGPNGSLANRAGFTHVRLEGRGLLSFQPALGVARRDGSVPFYDVNVTVLFRLTDFSVAISSNYPEGSCAYDATLQHELDAHIRAPIKILMSYRDPLIAQLNTIPLPTRHSPKWVHASEWEAVDGNFQGKVYQAVADIKAQVATDLNSDRDNQDSQDNYGKVYGKCPPAQWNRTR